jgi:threonine aldolase
MPVHLDSEEQYMFIGIDLSSDTATRPTAAMKQAMMNAELGDEQKGEDPTTQRLEEIMAEKLGHSAAMFFPSATMANEVAIRLFCEPGDELLAADNCHLFFAETGGPAVHAQVMARSIPTASGIFTAADVRGIYRWSQGPNYPRSKLLSVENTTNMGGGIAWRQDELNSVLDAARDLKLKTHLDGSRLFNAAVRTGLMPQQIAARFDAVTICLSKGLGCPLGAVLAFAKEHWEQVRRLKQLMGGAMRQSGMLAAAGIYALQHHVERLQEDHDHAQLLAEKLAGITPITVETHDSTLTTNLVFFRWRSSKMTAREFAANCQQRGVRFLQTDENRLRAVTHLDIKRADIEQAARVMQDVCRAA